MPQMVMMMILVVSTVIQKPRFVRNMLPVTGLYSYIKAMILDVAPFLQTINLESLKLLSLDCLSFLIFPTPEVNLQAKLGLGGFL